MRLQHHAVVLVVMLAALRTGFGEEGDKPRVVIPAEQLIEQLGDPVFSIREAAAAELIQRGHDVEDALTVALESPDLEIRLRVRQLLDRLSEGDLQARLKAFIDDVDGKQDHDLPSWSQFREVAGNNRETRQLFAEMVRDEAPLLKAYEDDKKQAVKLYAARVMAMQEGAIPGLPPTRSTASLATLLFVGSDEEVPQNTSLGYQMYGLLNQSAARQSIEKGKHSSLIKDLLGSWIERGMSNSSMARNGFMLAQRYKLDDTALALARKVVAAKSTASYALPYAVLALGKYGEEKDVSLLDNLMTNKTVCHSWHNSKFKDPIRIQVRDVALAVAVHLTKQDHKKYGFDLLRKDPNGLFYVYTLGFPTDELRDASFAKWTQWKKEQAG